MASKAFLKIQEAGITLLDEVSRLNNCDLNEKRSKLASAKKLFDEELAISSNPYERAYSCQNLGALHWAWGKLELDSLPSWEPVPQEKLATVTADVAQAVGFFLKAMVEGSRADLTWKLMGMQDCSLHVVNWVYEQSKKMPLFDAPYVLRRLCVEFDRAHDLYGMNLSAEAAVIAHLELAKSLLQNRAFQKLEVKPDEEWFRLLERVEQGVANLSPNSKESWRISNLQDQVQIAAVVATFELAKSIFQRAELNGEDIKSRARCLHLLQEAEHLLAKLPRAKKPLPLDKILSLRFRIEKKPPIRSILARVSRLPERLK